MAELSDLELEIAHAIVEALNLEDVRAEDIDPDEPLFGDGLGLDFRGLWFGRWRDVPVLFLNGFSGNFVHRAGVTLDRVIHGAELLDHFLVGKPAVLGQIVDANTHCDCDSPC